MSQSPMSPADNVAPALHVLTITPFFPSDQNEVSGCFVAEPIEQLKQFGVDSSVIATAPIYHLENSQVQRLPQNGCDIRRFLEISGYRARATCSMPVCCEECKNCTARNRLM